MRKVDRILLVAADDLLPGPSFSGVAVIRWSLIDGLYRTGAQVGFYSASETPPPGGKLKTIYKPEDSMAGFPGANFWFGRPGPEVTAESTTALAQAIAEFRPDVILAYGMKAVRLVRAAGYTGLLAIMSIDMEGMPRLYRDWDALRYGRWSEKLERVTVLPRNLVRAVSIRREVLRDYRLADLVINHAHHHAEWHRRRHGRPTLYTPNPVTKLTSEAPVRSPIEPPRFALLGGLAGTATSSGLAWFARKVYPRIEQAIASGEMEVHLIGRHATKLGDAMPRVLNRGYVEDLAAELAGMRAMLVPTPIRLGFRTRILDAFRHGVAVIAHSANAAGMRELVDGANCLLASDGETFAGAMSKLAEDRDMSERLAKAGYDQFMSELNADVVAAKILRFVAEA